MLVSVVQIGNSRGIRLPKNVLSRLDIKDKVEMVIHEDELVIKSVNPTPRQGWNEAFEKISRKKTGKLLFPENIDSDAFEWEW